MPRGSSKARRPAPVVASAWMFTALSALSGCGDRSPTAPGPTFRRVATGDQSIFVEQVARVARDAGEWQTLRTELRLFTQGDAIDFSSEMAVAVMIGRRPSSGYAVRVDSISMPLQVEATEVTPHPSCGLLAVITSPFEVIAVPRSSRSPVVAWRKMQRPDCR